MKKPKKLKYTGICVDCKVEIVQTEKGILCPGCGNYISDKDINDENFS